MSTPGPRCLASKRPSSRPRRQYQLFSNTYINYDLTTAHVHIPGRPHLHRGTFCPPPPHPQAHLSHRCSHSRLPRFQPPRPARRTLKDSLESPRIPTVFVDVRKDSNALYCHFGITLQGIEHVQAVEVAWRAFATSRKYLGGLGKFIQYDVLLSRNEKLKRSLAKEEVERIWDPQKGGSPDMFNARTLTDITPLKIPPE
ncbi:uncharacterized protein BCR38DRAFT_405909 [Pseudomassariella vexata]|uniref:Uncharacterized protein n=1 Tax=Pseudomassariella vexata TaxID=1141098 RepID=A0A1Y2EFD8_9PEZI|nr:uncharacterized protein BCR38DRAFT_405909 [Pseudomassariella vexata]ORY70292.1 hypothetical protein BCR38DRAFT_405909 [Pseudomassariella vexata]